MTTLAIILALFIGNQRPVVISITEHHRWDAQWTVPYQTGKTVVFRQRKENGNLITEHEIKGE